MNIAYVRRFFPENTETFLIEEIIALKKQGHQVRLYCEKGNFARMHRKITDEQLLDNVIYCRQVQPISTNAGSVGMRIRHFISNRPKKGFLKNHYPHRRLHREFFDALGNSLKRRSLLEVPICLGCNVVLVLRLSLAIGNLSVAISQFIAEKREFRPEVVHCPFTFRWDTLMMTKLLEAYPGIPFTVTLRARELYTAVNDEAFTKFRRDLLGRANRIITISQYNRSTLREAFSSHQDFPIVHSSIDPSFFSPKRDPNDKYPNQIVAVARLVEKKGLKYLIEACALLQHAGIDFICKIAGEGPRKEFLRGLIDQYRLSERVYIEGPFSSEEIRDLLDESVVFVLPCIVAQDGDRDVLPNSLKEAMSMALPVVTSDISGIGELIKNGLEGMLVPPHSAEAIAHCISMLFRDKNLCKKLGQGAREKIIRDFNIDMEGKKFSDLLKEAAHERGPTLFSNPVL